MRSQATPEAIKELALSIVTQAGQVVGHYRWLHSAAHDRTVGDDVRVRSQQADPTGGLVASDHKQAARDALRSTYEDMKTTLADLKAIEARLLRTLDRFDPPQRPEPSGFPRTALRADVAAAKEAQERRRMAGEDVPA